MHFVQMKAFRKPKVGKKEIRMKCDRANDVEAAANRGGEVVGHRVAPPKQREAREEGRREEKRRRRRL